MAQVLWRCRTLYKTALEERKTAWDRCHVSVSYYQQKAELPDLKAACPDYAAVNAHVLQNVILRVERAFQAFFRRLKAGEQPGSPRFQGRTRYHSFPYPQYGGGVVLDGGVLSLSKMGRIPLRLHRPLHRPLHGSPKTVTISKEADGWYACISWAEVPTEPLPLTGRETGIDVGLKVVLITSPPMARWSRTRATTAVLRSGLPKPSGGWHGASRAASAAARPWRSGSASTQKSSGNARTSTRRPH